MSFKKVVLKITVQRVSFESQFLQHCMIDSKVHRVVALTWLSPYYGMPLLRNGFPDIFMRLA